MKQNKWLVTAICACAAFFSGLVIGLSFSGKKQKKADAKRKQNRVNEKNTNEAKEERPDE